VFVSSAAGVAWHPLPNTAWPGAAINALLDLPVGPPRPAAPGAAVAVADGGGGGGPRPPLRRVLWERHGIDGEALLPPGTPLMPILAIGSNASPEQLVGAGEPTRLCAGLAWCHCSSEHRV
jgi:hypothetical protein